MSLPSTRWAYTEVKIAPAARPRAQRERSAHDSSARRNWRKPATIQVSYRGGPEAWWEIRNGSGRFRFPGHLCLHDVLMAVHEGRGWHID